MEKTQSLKKIVVTTDLIKDLLNKESLINCYGYGGNSIDHLKKIFTVSHKDRDDLLIKKIFTVIQKDRDKLLIKDVIDQIQACVDWLVFCNIPKTKTIRKNCGSSYHFKHVVERSPFANNCGHYIYNGAFIVAAILCGYDFSKDTHNPCFNFSKKHLNFLTKTKKEETGLEV